MRKLLYFFSFCFLLTNCNDGDIITLELGFDDIEGFSECGEMVFYKVKEDPFESLSLNLTSPIDNIEDLLQVEENDTLITSYTINSNNAFNYRTYAEDYSSSLADDLFCQDVPPNVTITNNTTSESGQIIVTTVLIEDDGDGIPAEVEDANEDGDNNYLTNPTDRDEDGIPDYLDDDDDGDNVPTKNENPNYTVEDGLANAQNTDSDVDDIPDYLDTDDDGDGIDTIDEENVDSQDQNPINDIFDGITANYLNDEYAVEVPATAYREHTIKQTYNISVEITDFVLPPLTQSSYDFGKLEPAPERERTITPEFN